MPISVLSVMPIANVLPRNSRSGSSASSPIRRSAQTNPAMPSTPIT
jgi:hypothetical protein